MDGKNLRVQYLVNVRNNCFNVAILIFSGLTGSLFVNISIIKMSFLIIVGLYIGYIFLLKFLDINDKTKKGVTDNDKKITKNTAAEVKDNIETET